MFFSKSFGYALRGVLYIALASKEQHRVQVDEIANKLAVPKHFLSKIMKKIVKAGILSSTKGPYGGFSLNHTTLATPLINIIIITDGSSQFNDCVLRLKKCNNDHPCPLHHNMKLFRNELEQLFLNTTVQDLLYDDYPDFIKSISAE